MTGHVRVCILGREGRMGREAARWISDADDLDLVAAIGRGGDWSSLSEADVALELTAAGNGAVHGRRLLEMGLRPVIGTSGVDAGEVAELDALALDLGLGGVVVPNFSAAMALLTQVAEAASRILPDISIAEAHRTEKLDAPSGTASDIAARLGLEAKDVASVRINGVTALHEVRLRGGAEEILLRHESLGLESFRAGLLQSLRYAAGAEGVAHGLEAVMGDACKLPAAV